MWLSLQECFISACHVIDWHDMSVQTALPTTDFFGRRLCLRHSEQTIPVPSSVGSIQGKSSFHAGSSPVRLVFDCGLPTTVTLLFTIFLHTQSRGQRRLRLCKCLLSHTPNNCMVLVLVRAARGMAYRPMCLLRGRHIAPIRLSIAGENTACMRLCLCVCACMHLCMSTCMCTFHPYIAFMPVQFLMFICDPL